MKCEICGRDVDLPFRCSFCGRNFCIEHRLPESHSCRNAPLRTPLGHWKSKKAPVLKIRGTTHSERSKEVDCPECKSERVQVSGYQERFVRYECLDCGSSWKTEKPTRGEKPLQIPTMLEREWKPTRSKTTVALIFVLIGVIAVSSIVAGNFYIQNVRLQNKIVSLESQLAVDGYNIRDPTYQEALQFVASDQTEKNQYDEETYTCHHFTADFKNNAFEVGYRCGYVYVELVEGAHAIVCFNTIDEGLLFIEPQEDDIVTLTIGQPYWDRTKYTPSYDDTIVDFAIIW